MIAVCLYGTLSAFGSEGLGVQVPPGAPNSTDIFLSSSHLHSLLVSSVHPLLLLTGHASALLVTLRTIVAQNA
ncbi:protein of unknown function [Nitrospira defluvii]|uniref:Uncharacterized protein n=1 Tax=Nitrospira defluvii TaxID=330214 RepID=D8PAH5_9BACT|nr:protein of unknown function [Nitrospira defluvii]